MSPILVTLLVGIILNLMIYKTGLRRFICTKIRSKLVKLKTLHKKMKFFIKDFFSKCDKIRKKLWIGSHLLKKPLMENFLFGAVRGAV